MSTTIKILKILLPHILAGLALKAQPPGGAQNMNVGHLYGKVLDASGKPIESASVQLLQNKLDTVSKKRREVVVAGMLTNKKGEFSLENLGVLSVYKLTITALGYKLVEQKVLFEINRGGDMASMMSSADKDLGNFKLEADVQQLQGVTVTSNKGLFTMNIDKKVFNVEKNLNSVGGTAVDVMKNVPLVNVDIDGNVSLRNASPQIFVDGRPTTLTLEQIPADAIASVEIITNPSAKYDASGGGAGILNIVLKKNRKAGYNGNIRAGIDSRLIPTLGSDISVKQGKLNLFANVQLGLRKSIATVNSFRTDFLGSTTASLQQENGPVSLGRFAFGRFGMDYFIDNRNTITLGANIVHGKFGTDDNIVIKRDTTGIAIPVSDYGRRTSDIDADFKNFGSTFSFKHNFAKAGKEWTADGSWNYSKNSNTGDYLTQYFNSNNTAKTPLFTEQSRIGGTTKIFTAQTDYVNPLTKTKKIEMGLRTSVRDFTSYNNNYYKNSAGEVILIPGVSNNYTFHDVVHAAYSTWSHQLKKFSYQFGLRVERSDYRGELVNAGQKFANNFPVSLFPSTYFNYEFTSRHDIQISYSRKINRPNFFQLIPFVDFTDSLNLSKGNPGLIPEFTNLVELSHQTQYGKGNAENFLVNVYVRNTENLITRYQYKEANPNPLKNDSVVISTFENAKNSITTGIEITGRNLIKPWWDFTYNLNVFNSTIRVANAGQGVNSELATWFIKINNNFKLPKNYSIQLSGDYQSRSLLPPGGNNNSRQGIGGFGQVSASAQGYIKPLYGVDFSIKKSFLKNNTASLTLQVSDIFRTRLNATHAESVYFVQDNERRRDPQVVRLNFNWRFGKFDVSLFKRKNMRSETEGIQNGLNGLQQ